MNTVLKNLFELMKTNNISGNQLQIACGFSNNALTLWKNRDTTPTFNNLQKIAEYFQVPVSYFYEDKEKKLDSELSNLESYKHEKIKDFVKFLDSENLTEEELTQLINHAMILAKGIKNQ